VFALLRPGKTGNDDGTKYYRNGRSSGVHSRCLMLSLDFLQPTSNVLTKEMPHRSGVSRSLIDLPAAC
jgi:hypothetical protein